MYKTYVWKIKPTSSFLTPWQSDTLYGHLLWAILFLYGEDELNEVIQNFKNFKAPFIVSNGFFGDELPFIKKEFIQTEKVKMIAKDIYGDESQDSLVKTIRGIKELNKKKTMPLDSFENMRGNQSNYEYLRETLKCLKKIDKNTLFKEIPILHNVVNRLSGVTEENGIYTLNEGFSNSTISIYIKLRDDFEIEKFDSLLKYIEATGFGKKTSSGKGQIDRVEFKEFNGFKEVSDANGYVVLSNFVPKKGDYKEIISGEVITKRAKAGNEIENSDFPFKKPFVCYIPGAIFKKGDNTIVGKVLENIHIDSKIIQIGIPFHLEVKI
ncbi:MAG: type III-A CRISPR-associated RAMP protein Csm4 [Fusobacteriaceae bacterium]